MFDRLTPTPSDQRQDDAARLCDRYDALLVDADAPLTLEATSELGALAAVYDIDATRSPAELWRDLRPVVTRQIVPTSADAPRPLPTARPLTLLVVEDDPDMAVDLTAALSEAGHRVIGPFHDAAAAESAAALHEIDLALIDLNLSGDLDGAGLARRLKDRWGVRALFLTGDVAGAARHAELAEGLVLKPYAVRDVLIAIEAASALYGD